MRILSIASLTTRRCQPPVGAPCHDELLVLNESESRGPGVARRSIDALHQSTHTGPHHERSTATADGARSSGAPVSSTGRRSGSSRLRGGSGSERVVWSGNEVLLTSSDVGTAVQVDALLRSLNASVPFVQWSQAR